MSAITSGAPSFLSLSTEQTKHRITSRTRGAVKVTAKNWILFEPNEVSGEEGVSSEWQ